MHKRLVEPVLQELEGEQAAYFYELVDRIERDARTEDVSNLVYLTLRDAIPVIPPLLDHAEVIEELFSFVGENKAALEHRIRSPRYLVDPAVLKPVVNLFVSRISDLCWRKVESGEITAEGKEIWIMQWPYADTREFPYSDEDDPEEDAS